MQSLSTSLEENKAYFQGRFAHSMDFITREFTLAGRKAALFAVDGLINKEIIALSVMEPLLKTQDYPPAPQAMLAHIERAVLSAAELKHERDLEKLLTLLMSGFVLLCVDGCDDGLVSGVQGFAYRGPQEPQNEVMQRGAKDGFTESNLLNMAMIRRRMKNPDLKFQPLEVGSQSHTPVVLCYLEGTAAPKLLRQVRQVLEDCPLQTVLGAGYLTRFLDKGRVFSGVGMTERPDVVCGKLEEGRVALLVEGTPSVILAPFLFVENFQTLDDYLTRPFYGTFIRWLKYIAFFLSAFLPGAYVAVVVHHPELLPQGLLLEIARAQAQTPLPLMVETLTAGGRPAGAPVAGGPGAHRRRPGAGGHSGGRGTGQRALPAGGGVDGHRRLRGATAVRAAVLAAAGLFAAGGFPGHLGHHGGTGLPAAGLVRDGELRRAAAGAGVTLQWTPGVAGRFRKSRLAAPGKKPSFGAEYARQQRYAAGLRGSRAQRAGCCAHRAPAPLAAPSAARQKNYPPLPHKEALWSTPSARRSFSPSNSSSA